MEFPKGWKISMLFLGAILALGGCTRQEPPKAAAPQSSAQAAAAAAENTIASGAVTFIEGQATVDRGQGWQSLSIGDQVAKDDKIKTGPGSSCEVQFGHTGTVRIAQNSTVSLKTIALSESRNVVDVSLDIGTVACKVHKLVSKDRFEVVSTTAVCSVRGPVFVVSKQSDQTMKIAVKEGKVAFLPPAFDAAKLDEASPDAASSVKDSAVDSILNAAPAVTADQEVSLSPAELEKSNIVMQNLQTQLVAALAENAAAQNYQASAAAKEAASASASPSSAASPAAAANPSSPADQSQQESKQILDTLNAALSSFSAAQKSSKTQIKPVSQSSQEMLKDAIKLDIKEQLPSAPQPSAGSTPPSAQSDSASAAQAVQKTPASQQSAVTVPQPVEPIKGSLKVSDKALVYGLQYASGKFFAADSEGSLAAFSPEGKLAWTAKSGNTENDNSPPVISNNYLAFAGDKSLCVLKIEDGSKAFSAALDANDSGLFGRRPVLANDRLYLGSNAGIKTLSLSDGSVSSTLVDSESVNMTPLLSGSLLYFADSSGTFCVLDPDKNTVTTQVKTAANQPIATSPVVDAGRAYFTDRKGLMVCIDLAKQKVIWQKKIDASKNLTVFHDPILAGSALYVFAKNAIYALSADNGDSLFPAIEGVAAPPAWKNDCLWFGLQGKKVAAADAATGHIRWQEAVSAEITGNPAAGGDRIAFPTESGAVILVDPAAALQKP